MVMKAGQQTAYLQRKIKSMLVHARAILLLSGSNQTTNGLSSLQTGAV